MWRALAKAYAEAGEFADAVFCYRKAIGLDKRGVCGLDARWQLANLEARLAAQVLQPDRRGMVTAEGLSPIKDMPADLFRTAESALRHLEHFEPSAELYAIRGSLYKKRASTRRPGSKAQLQDLGRSMVAYEKALNESWDSDVLNVYHASLFLQMAHAFDGGRPEQLEKQQRTMARLESQLMMYERGSGDYFERAQQADIIATGVIASSGLRDPDKVTKVVDAFTRAFQVRSSRRQRLSVIDNYWDLHYVLQDDAERQGARAVAKALDAFTPAHGRARSGA